MLITKGKTNVAYLFVVIILAIFAGGAMLAAFGIINCPYFFSIFGQSNSKTVDLGKEFTVNFNGTVDVKGENLKIQFLDVTEDSRCPQDVQCIWAGQAKIVLSIHKNNQKNLGNYEFLIQAGNSPMQKIEGYLVKIVKLEPYPVSTKNIEKNDYKATLIVSKNLAVYSCQTAEDCVPVSCGCKCSGCGGFDFEEIVNKNSAGAWYLQHSCQKPTICLQVCCQPVTIACENNICVAKEGEQ